MKSKTLTCIIAMTLFAALAVPIQLAAQHTRYKLVVIGTLGGPQSYGDAGHGAANMNNRGIAAGVADTAVPYPFYPNFNPLFTGGSIQSYPYVFHAFTTNGSKLIDLGSLPGANSSTPSHIADNGLVVGTSQNGSIDPITGWPQINAVLWTDGQIINLGTLGGYESQTIWVDSHGQVLGNSTNNVPDPYSFIYGGTPGGTQNRAFVWDLKKGMRDLGTLGGPDAAGFVMNERGQIAGISYINDIANANGTPTIDPFLWEDGKMTDLGTLGGTFGLPNGINNRGQIVGQSNLAGDLPFHAHAFLWDHGRLQDLGALGGNFSAANAINDNGEIIGYAATTGDQPIHAFLWKRGSFTDLGTLGSFDCSYAFGINSKTQVVGQSGDCNGVLGARAFLWQNGQMIDLNVFVPPGVDLTLTEVEQINDRGEMFGIGTRANGEDRAFLLIPCGESEEGCIDASESIAAARQVEPQVIKGLATQPHTTPTAIAAWRARLARRYHIPGLWTPRD